MLREISVEIIINQREHKNVVFWFQKFFKRIYNYFVTNNFKTLCKRNSIDVEINFHHSWKFHNNILKHFWKCIKDLCWSVFAIRVIAKFNYDFIYVYEMRYIDLKNFHFYNESRNNLQMLRLHQRFAHTINLNFVIQHDHFFLSFVFYLNI